MIEKPSDNRISAAKVVRAKKPIIRKDSVLNIWMDPSQVLVVDSQGSQAPSYSMASILSGPSTIVTPGTLSNQTDATIKEADESVYINRGDTPDLSDIESIVVTQYKDTLGNQKAKAVIKVRNSFSFPENVVGVDARIYNPFA